jgi:hypothetical protein
MNLEVQVIVKDCKWLVVSWLAIQVGLDHDLSAPVSNTHTPLR